MPDENNRAEAPTDPAISMGATAVQPEARFDRADWWSFAVTSFLSLTVYLFTLAPNVTLEFSGILSTAAFYGGVAPPAGHPLWTIYSWLFTRLLPFSNIAWRVGVGSAVAAALASGIVALTVSFGANLLMDDSAGFGHLTSPHRRWLRIVCGYVSGMALGLSGAVWGAAVVADVWTLSLLLFAAILCLSFRWLKQPGRKRFLCPAFLLFGLLLTGNQEMIVTLPGLVFVAMLGDRDLGRDLALSVLPLAAVLTSWNQFGLWMDFPQHLNWPLLIVFGISVILGLTAVIITRRIGSAWKFGLLCNVAFFLGLSLCFYLPLVSMTNPSVNWGYPRVVQGFLHVLSRGQFERIYPTADLGRYLNQLRLFLKMSGKELGWVYLFLSALPVFRIVRINQGSRKWLFALVAMFVCAGPVLIAELNPPPDRVGQELWVFYCLPAFAIISVLVGLGLALCVNWISAPSTCDSSSAPRGCC